MMHNKPSTVPVRTCDMCGTRRARKVSKYDRYGFNVPMLKCSQCGLYRMTERVADPATWYDSGAYRKLVSAYHGRRIDAKTIQAEQIKYAEELEVFLHPRTFDSVLDIGGSTGIVSRYVGAMWNADVTVIDPAGDELQFAKGCTRLQCTAEDFKPKRQYAIGLLCQTIEHLVSPCTVLSMLRTCCDSIFVDAVDVELLSGMRTAAKLDHTWGFTDNTCRALLGRTGWHVVAAQTSDDNHRAYLCAQE